MDTASRRPQLPALSYLDQPKREEESQYNRTPGLHPSTTAASPSYPYSAPSQYGHLPPHNTNTWHGGSVHTPPESRRTSGDDCDNHKLHTKQSLPSISEALGVESQTYPASTSIPQPTAQSTHLPHQQPGTPSSPTIGAKRSFGTMEPTHSHNTYANGANVRLASFRQDSAGPQSYPPSESSKPAYAPPPESRPPLHLQTPQPPQAQHSERYGTSSTTSPQYPQNTSHSAGSMAPPTFPYGYTPYPPRYAQQTPSSTSTSGPIYQPSSQHAAPSTPATSWKTENPSSRYSADEATYSESVKRHLDLYELEGALNEIARNSSIMLDFSHRYGDRMHQNARSGPTSSSLPSVIEVEDMINKSRIQQESLQKIREVIIAQQHAYEQQMADQRQQHKSYHEQPPLPAEQSQDADDMKGGFAAGDTKKRRGRAAPPGRCHSCNRAETPEWRRGPDGARTLCNACGLHYAKLTRKQTGANKGAVGSSNLRPKEA